MMEEEETIDRLVGSVKSASDPGKKAEVMQVLTQTLKDSSELPPASMDALCLLVPHLLSHHSHLVFTPALSSFLPALIPHLPTDKLRLAVQTAGQPLIEKLADAKERVHRPAEDCLIALLQSIFRPSNALSTSSTASSSGPKGKEKEDAPQIAERLLRDALTGRSSRTKLGAMKVAVGVKVGAGGGHSNMPLKPFLPLLVDNLEDADGAVREYAKESIVAILGVPGVPLAARSEFRKLCEVRSIKTNVVDGILAQLVGIRPIRQKNSPIVASRTVSAATTATATSTTSTSSSPSAHGHTRTSMSESEELPPASGTPGDIPTIYISTERELEDEFLSMSACFEGKETEHNWIMREKAIIKVRGMIKAGIQKQYPQPLVSCLKAGFLANSVKALLSLRTTLASATTALYAELASTLGTAFDPLVDTILPSLGKMAASTKKIVVEASQKAVTTIIRHTSAPSKVFVPFLIVGLGDKTTQARQHFASHLYSYIQYQAQSSREAIEHCPNDGFNQLQAALRKSLTDSAPAVRETARAAYWLFSAEWPQEAAKMMSQLDEPAQKQLIKAKQTTTTTTSAPAKSAGGPRKPSSSIAEAIRKAKLEAKRQQQEAEQRELAQQPQNSGSPGTNGDTTHVEVKERAKPSSEPKPASDDLPSPSKPLVETRTPKSPAVNSQRDLPTQAAHSLLDDSFAFEHPLISDGPPSPSKPIEQDLPLMNGLRILDELENEQNPSAALNSDDLNSPPAKPAEQDLPLNGHRILESSKSVCNSPALPALDVMASAPTQQVIQDLPTMNTHRILETLADGDESPTNMAEPSNDSLYGVLQIAPDTSFWRQRRAAAFTSGERQGSAVDLSSLSESDIAPQTALDIVQNVMTPPSGWTSDADNKEVVASIGEWTCQRDVEQVKLHDAIRRVYIEVCKNGSQRETSFTETVLLLLWEIAIKLPSIIADDELPLISYCLDLRQHSSAQLRRASSSLLTVIAQTSSSPILLLHILLRSCEAARQALQGAGQNVLERVDVMTCITVSLLLIRLPATILEDEAHRLRPLIYRSLSSRSVITREAGTTLLLIPLSVFHSSTAELLEHFPDLTASQMNLIVYLLKKHEKVTLNVKLESQSESKSDPSRKIMLLDPEAIGRSSRRLSMNV